MSFERVSLWGYRFSYFLSGGLPHSVHCWFAETNLRFHHDKMLMLGEAGRNAPQAADLNGFPCFGMIANVIQMKLLEGKDSPS